MNQILKGMKERRSIRKFQSKMPEKKAIQKIVEAGLYAANGRGEQAVLTIAITNKKMRDKIVNVGSIFLTKNLEHTYSCSLGNFYTRISR